MKSKFKKIKIKINKITYVDKRDMLSKQKARKNLYQDYFKVLNKKIKIK